LQRFDYGHEQSCRLRLVGLGMQVEEPADHIYPIHRGTFPVLYPGANVPQGWAAGSVFHLLQAILGLRADAPRQRLSVDAVLPRWLPDLTLRGLRVGRATLDLRFWRDGESTRWESSVREGTVEVRQEPWRPWSATC